MPQPPEPTPTPPDGNATNQPLPQLPLKIKKQSAIDAPLISLSINNPFKKILIWLNEIRKKQTTEFDLKLKIPIFAWLVFLSVLFGTIGLSFNLTQYIQGVQFVSLVAKSPSNKVTVVLPTSVPTPVLLSRIGIIKATYQLGGLISITPSASPNAINHTPSAAAAPSRYVLVTSIDQLAFITLAPGVSVSQYLNKRVLVTGLYDVGKNTILIRGDSDIEFMP